MENTKKFGILGFLIAIAMLSGQAGAISGGFFPEIPGLEDTDFQSCSFFCVLMGFDYLDVYCGELSGEEYEECEEAAFQAMLDCYEECEEEYSWCEGLGYIDRDDCGEWGWILPSNCPSAGGGGTYCSESDCIDMGYVPSGSVGYELAGGLNITEGGSTSNWCFNLPFSPCLLILLLVIVIIIMGAVLYLKLR